MSLLRNVYTTMADSPSVDGFSRARVSQPAGLFECKFLYDNQPILMQEIKNGSSSIVYVPAESAISLTAGSGTTDYAIKQSRIYIPYTPGKSNLILMTGLIGSVDATCARKFGYFDDLNGLFFECSDDIYVVERSNVSGNVVDTKTGRDLWNIDKLNGSGPSGETLHLDRTQIFVIDFQWLGVGRVRYGFDIGGKIVYCHESVHANESGQTTVYMRTPSLPIRWEIRKLSGTGTPAMKAFCASVSSEGGYVPLGLNFSAGNGITKRSTSTQRTPIFAVRLKNTFNSKQNRRLARFLGCSLYSQSADHFFEIIHSTDVTSVTGNFTSAGAYSGCEYSVDITAITSNATTGGDMTLQTDLVTSGVGNNGGNLLASPALQFLTINQQLAQNYDSSNSQYWTIFATTISGNGYAIGSLSWLEVD